MASQQQSQDHMVTMAQVERDIMSRPPEHNMTNLDLDRMEYILDILGHPEQSMRVIHVTGTNGKGSTARMAEALCRAYGLRTGLYTSPHLQRINERIMIDGNEISDDAFIELWCQMKDIIAMVDARMDELNKPHMSFFEVLTAMAIWAFADAPVDVAVVEVGMGGKWDATNVLNANAAVIGPIDMDHMRWLGSTVEAIAETKAGIIKEGSTVILAPQPHEEQVLPIIQAAAREQNALLLRDAPDGQLHVLSRQPAVGGQLVTLETPLGRYEEVPIDKFGEHQAHNALVALAAAEVVLPVNGALEGDRVSEALSNVRIPGRIEQVRTSPTIIIDGGHNVNAAESLRATIEENYQFDQLVGVVAMMADKQVEAYLGVLEPILSQIVVTSNSWHERVMDPKELERIAINVFGAERVHRADELPDAIQTAVNLVDEGDELGVGYGRGVLICGSFVTAGDARTMLVEHDNPELSQPKASRAGIHPNMGEDQDVSASNDTDEGWSDDVDFESSDVFDMNAVLGINTDVNKYRKNQNNDEQ